MAAAIEVTTTNAAATKRQESERLGGSPAPAAGHRRHGPGQRRLRSGRGAALGRRDFSARARSPACAASCFASRSAIARVSTSTVSWWTGFVAASALPLPPQRSRAPQAPRAPPPPARRAQPPAPRPPPPRVRARPCRARRGRRSARPQAVELLGQSRLVAALFASPPPPRRRRHPRLRAPPRCAAAAPPATSVVARLVLLLALFVARLVGHAAAPVIRAGRDATKSVIVRR